jgi:hypothetical protein
VIPFGVGGIPTIVPVDLANLLDRPGNSDLLDQLGNIRDQNLKACDDLLQSLMDLSAGKDLEYLDEPNVSKEA